MPLSPETEAEKNRILKELDEVEKQLGPLLTVEEIFKKHVPRPESVGMAEVSPAEIISEFQKQFRIDLAKGLYPTFTDEDFKDDEHRIQSRESRGRKQTKTLQIKNLLR